MKRFLLPLLLSSLALAQTTPNLGLNLPSAGTQNWDVPLNANFNTLDSYLSGTFTLPAFKTLGLTANAFTLNGVGTVNGPAGTGLIYTSPWPGTFPSAQEPCGDSTHTALA